MMPIYEYECEKCACRFELKRGFSEHEGSPCCPKCRGKARQLFFPSVILFKGSGFYVTDSRSNLNHPSEADKAGKIDGSKKEEGKSNGVEDIKKEAVKADKVQTSKMPENK
jgi:putative FmdB family regulatory protein